MAYEEKIKAPEKPHNIILENRSRMSISGVTEVERFDEQEAIIVTNKGALLIHGTGLHVEKLSLDTGEITLQGTVDSLQYEDTRKDGGFFARLFR